MPDWPGWDSLDAVTRIHSWAEASGIVLLGLLVVAEVITFKYSGRKDALVEAQQSAEKRSHDDEMARIHLETARLSAEAETAKAAIASADADAAKANERAAELKLALEREIAARQPRKITPEQHAAIVKYLANAAPKGEIVVVWKLFDEEAEQFGKQVISVLNDAGFQAKGGQGALSFGIPGAWIVVRDLAKLRTTPNPIGAIQGAFRDICGITLDGQQRTDPFPDLGEVVIAIGAKP